VNSELPDDDRRGPPFFFSYHRAKAPSRAASGGRDYNRHAQRVFDDLSEDLTHLLPLPTGQDPGYMDVEMEFGQTWEPELLTALGTCQVFVALLNESYLHQSEWCAKEWHLFAQRTVATIPGQNAKGGHQTAILPILWAPISGTLPPAVSNVQHFTPTGVSDSCVSVYQQEGLLGMINLNHEAYRPTVWRIARQIQQMWYSYRVTPMLDLDPTMVPKSFIGGAA
jgi:hypothetical protein